MFNKKIIRFMNADDGAGTGAQEPATETVEKTDQKFFTQDELDAIIDKRIARERKKFDTEKEKIEKLSKMSIEERVAAEKEEQQKKLMEYIEKAEKLEAKQYAQEALTQYGVPVTFADFVMNSDKELAVANIKLLKTEFDKAVQSKVKEALAASGSTPQQPKQVNSDNKPNAKSSLAEWAKYYQNQNKQE